MEPNIFDEVRVQCDRPPMQGGKGRCKRAATHMLVTWHSSLSDCEPATAALCAGHFAESAIIILEEYKVWVDTIRRSGVASIRCTRCAEIIEEFADTWDYVELTS